VFEEAEGTAYANGALAFWVSRLELQQGEKADVDPEAEESFLKANQTAHRAKQDNTAVVIPYVVLPEAVTRVYKRYDKKVQP